MEPAHIIGLICGVVLVALAVRDLRSKE